MRFEDKPELSATQVRTLWAAAIQPDRRQVQTVDLRFGGAQPSSSNGTKLDGPLPADALAWIDDAHLLFLVTDLNHHAWADAVGIACRQSGKSSPIHVVVSGNPSEAQAACIAIRTLDELLKSDSPVAIDIEDVHLALSGNGPTYVSVATAMGETRALDATKEAVRSYQAADQTVQQRHGALLIFCASSETLKIRECSTAVQRLQSHLPSGAWLAYGLLYDEALGEEMRVVAFVSNSPGAGMSTSVQTGR